MTTVDVLTLIFALWGAILSTILGIRELRREKRNLRVFLEFITMYDRYQIVIVNSGYRPVTISRLSINGLPAYKGAPDPFDGLEIGPFLTEEDEKKLPLTLNDGEAITLEIGHMLQDRVSHGKGSLEILVYDAEGKVYKSKTVRAVAGDTNQNL